MWKEVMAKRQTEVPTYATMEFSVTLGLSVGLTTPHPLYHIKSIPVTGHEGL
jgi:hypothetical protein